MPNLRLFTESAKAIVEPQADTNLEYLVSLGIILTGAACLTYICYCWDMGLGWAPTEEYEANLREHIACCCGPCIECCCGEMRDDSSHQPMSVFRA